MPRICFSVDVDNIENCEVRCSSAELSIDRANIESGTNVALILGLPVSITKRELEIFVDPFVAGIEGLCLLTELKKFSGHLSIFQCKKMALIFFTEEAHVAAFRDLYNNMQLPSYSETAPCVVVQLSELLVHGAADICKEQNLHNPHAKSATTSSVPSPMHPLTSGSPGRALSPAKSLNHESLLLNGINLLLQFSTPEDFELPSADGFAKSVKGESGVCEGSVSQMVALPTCTVCLRRIRCVSNLAQGLGGANDLMVGRSYTCDAKLTYDELSSAVPANFTNSRSCAVMKVAAVPDSQNVEDSTGVWCIVCHTYHVVTMSRSIGASSSSSYSPRARLSAQGADSSLLGSPVADSSGAPVHHSTGLGRCRMCNLSENIWLCLQCGHTGCGRYTSQHAKTHYQDTLSHNLSLELASGRIWNYESDTFDYIEDESSHYFSSHSAGFGSDAATGANDMEPFLSNLPFDHSSPTLSKKFLLPSFLYTGERREPSDTTWSFGNPRRATGQSSSTELLTAEAAASLGLDSVTTDKINALMNHYEHLLEAQLLDQQLYFEKLLARETVRALEQSYQPQAAQEKNASGLKPSAGATSSKKAKPAPRLVPVEASSAEVETKEDSPTEHTASHSNYTVGSAFLTHSSSFVEASSELENEEVLRDMQEVERLKMEISTIEAQYRSMLEAVKCADDAARRAKKANDVLIRAQKTLKEKEADLKEKAALVRSQHDEEVRDLEQQIQDLTFYAKTRKQVQESPYKDEIKLGTVVTQQRPPSTPTASSTGTATNIVNNNNGGGSGGSATKKTSGRKT